MREIWVGLLLLISVSAKITEGFPFIVEAKSDPMTNDEPDDF